MSLTAEEFSHVLALFKTKSRQQPESKSIKSEPSNSSCSDQAGRLIDLSSNYTALTKSQEADKKMNGSPVSCQYCPKQFQTSQMLRQHFLYRHSSVGIKCDKCYFIARSQADYDKHTCKAKQVLDCPSCTEKFRSKRDLMIHQKVHDLKYKCTKCDKQYADLIRLKKHMRDCHVDDGFVCSTCGKKFNCKETFSYHVKFAHSEEKPHACSYCRKTFKNSKYLKIHINLQHGVAISKRANSTEKCAYKEQLDIARQVQKKAAERRAKQLVPGFESTFKAICPGCHKILSSETALYTHKILHKNPKVCSKCKAEFAWMWHLRKHERKCTGVPSTRMLNKKLKPYQCFLCNTRFINGSQLTDHMREHAKLDLNLGGADEEAEALLADSPDAASSPSDPVSTSDAATSTSASANNAGVSLPSMNYMNVKMDAGINTGVKNIHYSNGDMRSRMETPIDFDERISAFRTSSPFNDLIDSVPIPSHSKQSSLSVHSNVQYNSGPSIYQESFIPQNETYMFRNSVSMPSAVLVDKVDVQSSAQSAFVAHQMAVASAQCQEDLDSVQGILNEVLDTGGPISPISDSCLNTPYATSLLHLDDSFVLPHDML